MLAREGGAASVAASTARWFPVLAACVAAQEYPAMRFEDLGPGRAEGVVVTKVVVVGDGGELVFVGVGHIGRRRLSGCLHESHVAHFHNSIKTPAGGHRQPVAGLPGQQRW